MSLFHHRDFHASIVVGDYLYIDGGEFATWTGKGDGLISMASYYANTSNIFVSPERHTRAIDLSKSWTNQSVTIHTIDKGAAPIVNGEALWPDANGKVFYAYNGGFSDQIQNRDYSNQLWQFTPSGSAGSWSLVSPSDSDFSSLSRALSASSASGNGVGYALGGCINSATGADTDTLPQPGLVTFDTKTKQWSNVTSDGYGSTGEGYDGVGQFIPSFGEDGVVLFMGGTVGTDEDLAMFDKVSMYNPASKQWATQKVSGDIPYPCKYPCAVGAVGDNGTYEVFLYGGNADDSASAGVEQGAVHVLSLPAFRWFKQATTPTSGRYLHTCNVVGNRQIMVVGGLPVTLGYGTEEVPPDQWHNGIGIFDMSEMEWSSQYNANAAPYISPKMVKEYYKSNPHYPSWSSPEIKQWFTQRNSDDNTSSSKDDQSSGTNVGAIAGGVVGGILALLIVIGLIVYFLRRRKQRQRGGYEHTSMPEEKRYPEEVRRTELDSDYPARHEMYATEKPGEVGGNALYEMPHDTR